MRRTIFCSILLGLILICSLTIPGERLSPCINSDDCGKVIGWIIDYDDGMVISEKFAITFISIIDGNPSKYAEVVLFKDIENYGVVGFGSADADENGYYYIVGIEEGVYRLRVEGDESECYYDNIVFTNNRVLDKNIIFNCKE